MSQVSMKFTFCDHSHWVKKIWRKFPQLLQKEMFSRWYMLPVCAKTSFYTIKKKCTSTCWKSQKYTCSSWIKFCDLIKQVITIQSGMNLFPSFIHVLRKNYARYRHGVFCWFYFSSKTSILLCALQYVLNLLPGEYLSNTWFLTLHSPTSLQLP